MWVLMVFSETNSSAGDFWGAEVGRQVAQDAKLALLRAARGAARRRSGRSAGVCPDNRFRISEISEA